MRARLACVFVCAMVCLLGASAALFAQGDLAAVTGRVLDPNGAVIVEATVSAKNADTGVETTVQTMRAAQSSSVAQPARRELTSL